MIEKLLEYQTVDGELRDIEVSLMQSEERKKASSAQAILKNANDNIARLDAKAEELASKHANLAKLCEKLGEAQKDYENIVETCESEEELNYIKKKAQGLADEINAMTASVENLAKEIKATLDEFAKLRADNKKATAQYKEFAPKYNELKASKEEDMKKIKAKLSKIEKGLPEDILENYKRKRKDKIFPIVYPVKISGKFCLCGRCGTELPMAYSGNLKKGEIVECDSCHRLLYMENN
ncbi:MAG: hypothetical protein IJ800_00665 [Clostridia bacterium]|nr:hypothetical protein [Clostridia bacterium]